MTVVTVHGKRAKEEKTVSILSRLLHSATSMLQYMEVRAGLRATNHIISIFSERTLQCLAHLRATKHCTA